jgi:hypothetical protein
VALREFWFVLIGPMWVVAEGDHGIVGAGDLGLMDRGEGFVMHFGAEAGVDDRFFWEVIRGHGGLVNDRALDHMTVRLDWQVLARFDDIMDVALHRLMREREIDGVDLRDGGIVDFRFDRIMVRRAEGIVDDGDRIVVLVRFERVVEFRDGGLMLGGFDRIMEHRGVSGVSIGEELIVTSAGRGDVATRDFRAMPAREIGIMTGGDGGLVQI